MCRNTTLASLALVLVLSGCLFTLALQFAWPSVARAESPPQRYIFVLSRLDLPAGAPAELDGILRKEMTAAIAKSPLLEAAIPKDAPPYDEKAKGRYGNKPFHKYMARHHLRAFKVTVQVTKYEPTLRANEKKPGQVVGCSIALRIFGETIPDRVMAFSGEGSATVIAEIGNKVRAKDRKWVDSDAAELAIEKAVAMSLTKLETKPAKTKKRRKKRRKKRPH
ncbi:MAG: hypothetical protein GY811_05545 [Myxococcales bacterium]|nr:hypothetical protein [Myxococcales bacterium]